MKRETILLRAAVYVIGLAILALCLLGIPQIIREAASLYPAHTLYPFFGLMYAAAVPFYMALYQALKLLGYIDRSDAFSGLSVDSLKRIKYCAVAIGLLYAADLPFFYLVADQDDAPGLIIVGLVVAAASIVIAVFAAVLQKLLKNAIDIKSENDLTV